ncbi:MAG: glycosyltransferase family 2 protein [Desulfomonilia bacterium]
MQNAPIAFFAYNRPAHTLQALTSLADNPEAAHSDLFVFCDAPKNPEHRQAVQEVRSIVASRKWCGSVEIIEHERNLGCAGSIASGVTRICETFRRAIVMEDDLILSSHFLEYMNTALGLYENLDQVMQISGHMFPIDFRTATDSIFLPFITSWGWATWQRAWKHFDPNASGYELLKQDMTIRHRFNIHGSYPYYDILDAQMQGAVDSWAIRWYLSVFLKNGLTLYPTRTLVENTGFDGSGTHCPNVSITGILKPSTRIKNFPDEATVDQRNLDKVIAYFQAGPKKQNPIASLLEKIYSRVKGIRRR